MRRDDETLLVVAREETNLGSVWRVERPGRTPRVHRSVVPALSTLREALAPARARGRALFVAPPPETDHDEP